MSNDNTCSNFDQSKAKAEKLHHQGYANVLVARGEKNPVEKNWQSAGASLEAIQAHNGNYGVLCASTPMGDVDVYDAELAAWVHSELFPYAEVIRYGRKPKFAVPHRTDKPFTKIKSAKWRNPDDWENEHVHQLEFLGEGQQCVVFGVHPDTGSPYSYESKDLSETPIESLPSINAEQARAKCDAFDQHCQGLGWERVGKASGGRVRNASQNVNADAFDRHVPPRKMDEGELEGLLGRIPAEDQDYDGYTTVGMAVYHQTGGKGFDLFNTWSSESGKHDEATNRAKWPSFAAATYDGDPVTVGTIEHMVRIAGGLEARKTLGLETEDDLDLNGKDPEGNAAAILQDMRLVRFMKQTYRYCGTHWAPQSDEQLNARINDLLLGKGFTPAQKQHTFDEVRRRSVVDSFAPDPARLALQNGVLNITGWDKGRALTALEPHAPEHNITSLLPFDFDPGARFDRWQQFLEEVLPDSSMQQLLQEYIGYCLVRDYRHQKMLLLTGESRSGKGTIARVLERLCEGATAGVSLSSLAGDRGLVILANAKVGIIGDAHRVDKSRIERAKEALLTITGQDSVQFDPKYKDAYSGKVPARLVLLANEMPRFFDKYDALANRYMVLEFKYSFAGREDPLLDQALEQELPGVLNWALEGLERLGRLGSFTDSESLRAARRLAAERNNPVGGFLARYVIRTYDGLLLTHDAYYQYRRYCVAFDHPTVSETTFGTALGGYLEDLAKKRVKQSGLRRTALIGAALDTEALLRDLGEESFDEGF
ncbi:phage/plasmid primase, P4 family [Congregibacter brevis]|uniref:Phage/plasmid primase, P4 family n=1 Tax=Congregibacter brevis TaxID=3081201 RepID=A0ABZ0I919_9GAMM|nr:phage/plasmid primase, P4 family [Congregibacter sp. IMCC45268]